MTLLVLLLKHPHPCDMQPRYIQLEIFSKVVAKLVHE